jgi:hypothetical protein
MLIGMKNEIIKSVVATQPKIAAVVKVIKNFIL